MRTCIITSLNLQRKALCHNICQYNCPVMKYNKPWLPFLMADILTYHGKEN